MHGRVVPYAGVAPSPSAGHRWPVIVASLVVLLLGMAAGGGAGRAATANAWLLDASGAVIGSYQAGQNAWTTKAVAEDDRAKISYQELDDGSWGAVTVGLARGGSIVLVNDLRGADPPLGPSLPRVSLLGFDPPLLDPSQPKLPGVILHPAGGTFAATVQITLRAAPPPAGGRASVHWRLDGGKEYCDQRLSPADTCAVARPTIFLAQAGDHRLEAWAVAAGGRSHVQRASFAIQPPAGEDRQAWQRRDTDGDGIPDLVEIPLGLDPLTPSLMADTDGDGWSDFDEILRGSDPARPDSVPKDTDGDGWSDFDEGLRSTNPYDQPLVDADGDGTPETLFFPDRPAATRLYEVEYMVGGGIYPTVAATEPQPLMGRLSARDLHWRLLYDQDGLPDDVTLETIGVGEEKLPARFRASATARTLAAGRLPPVRLPAGEPVVLRAVRLDRDGDGVGDRWDNCVNLANADQADSNGDGVGDACAADPGAPPALWVVKGWLPAAADVGPAGFAAWLAAQGVQWHLEEDPKATAGNWLDLYADYLADVLVQEVSVRLDPASGIGIALVEGLLHWFSGMSDGALILLGNGIAADQGRAMDALRNALGDTAAAGQGAGLLDRLHAALLAQASGGGVLAGFTSLVLGYYANPQGVSAASTTEAAYRAARGDGIPPDLAAHLPSPVRLPQAAGNAAIPPEILAEIQAVYLARLLAVSGADVLESAPADRRAVLLDPFADYDGDGLANLSEVAAADPRTVSDPTALDSDGDGLADGQDRCAADPTDGCDAPPLTDADGDGWPAPADHDDQDASVHPGAAELCDNKDNDQDGKVDEGACLAPGDINGDGAVDLADAVLLLRLLAGLVPEGADALHLVGDPDNNGRLNAADLALLLRWLAETP